MKAFIYESLPQRVVFGTGTIANVGDELNRLGLKRALVITTPGHEARGQRLVEALGALCVGHYAGAAMHTPVPVTNDAMARVRELEIDAVVALGGGSAIGLGKAIAVRTDLPQIVIPTTYRDPKRRRRSVKPNTAARRADAIPEFCPRSSHERGTHADAPGVESPSCPD